MEAKITFILFSLEYLEDSSIWYLTLSFLKLFSLDRWQPERRQWVIHGRQLKRKSKILSMTKYLRKLYKLSIIVQQTASMISKLRAHGSYCLIASGGQESGLCLAGCLWHWVFHDVAMRPLAIATMISSLTWGWRINIQVLSRDFWQL